jgi:hypothetical protein
MKSYIFITEKTNTGYSAWLENSSRASVSTTGRTISELKINALNALNLLHEHLGKKQVIPAEIKIKLDVAQFFEHYKIINAKAFSERIGMNNTLLSQYVNGSKYPGKKQVDKIIAGLREIGRELMELELG